ncbi:hypothetical protein RAC83_002313 [Xylella fastidiosa]|nr:hypothetical protein [Xylella fastidiosa]
MPNQLACSIPIRCWSIVRVTLNIKLNYDNNAEITNLMFYKGYFIISQNHQPFYKDYTQPLPKERKLARESHLLPFSVP